MKTKIIIKSIFGDVLFEFEKENNTIKETIEEAVKQGADLKNAYLQGAKLQFTNLQGADLKNAYLQGTDLQGAKLQFTNLQFTNLQGADLKNAYLQGADLQGADLQGAKLQFANLPIHCKWSHAIQDGYIRIGCKVKSIKQWDSFFNSDEEFETKRDTQDFKQIRAVFESYKAYLNVLNS